MEIQEPATTVRTVTCRTEGCENADIPITLPCVDLVICGVCTKQITEIEQPHPPVEEGEPSE